MSISLFLKISFFAISSRILRIVTEHIDKVCSLESKLFLIPICSIGILNILEVIGKTKFSKVTKCLTLVQGGYSISLRANDIVYHYRISTELDWFYISPASKFNSLVELIRHHSTIADGLIIPLKFAIPNSHHKRNRYSRPDQWEIDRHDVRIQV